jgi:hypothetical protein
MQIGIQSRVNQVHIQSGQVLAQRPVAQPVRRQELPQGPRPEQRVQDQSEQRLVR